jgi:hypothetical protein
VFSTLSGVATSLRILEPTMDHNSNPTSLNLGVFVVLGIVPIRGLRDYGFGVAVDRKGVQLALQRINFHSS